MTDSETTYAESLPSGQGRARVVLNSEREDIVLHEFSSGDDFQIPPRRTGVVMASRDFKVATLACVRPLFKYAGAAGWM